MVVRRLRIIIIIGITEFHFNDIGLNLTWFACDQELSQLIAVWIADSSTFPGSLRKDLKTNKG